MPGSQGTLTMYISNRITMSEFEYEFELEVVGGWTLEEEKRVVTGEGPVVVRIGGEPRPMDRRGKSCRC